jgi:Tn3 transposase DDE domain
MRDLTRVTLVRDDTPTEIGKLYPHAGPLLGARWNEVLISDCWGDLLRTAGSLKYGQAAASLIVGKWSAASRQNTLAAVLKECGMLRRTLHTAKYLSDPVYRRKISRQLNKGESPHRGRPALLPRCRDRTVTPAPSSHYSSVISPARPKASNRAWSWKTMVRLMPDVVTVKTWRVFSLYPPSSARM